MIVKAILTRLTKHLPGELNSEKKASALGRYIGDGWLESRVTLVDQVEWRGDMNKQTLLNFDSSYCPYNTQCD